MNKNLSDNLYSKHKLKFVDNKFRILMMSDVQESLDFNPLTLEKMKKLVETVNPDLVVFGGDNCNGLTIKTENDLKKYLEILTSSFEERHVPWCHVFGNHDYEIPVNSEKLTEIYESFDYSVSKHTRKIHGTTNFVLPVFDTNGDKIVFNVWGLDSGGRFYQEIEDFEMPSCSYCWDAVHFDQLKWYYDSSKELEKYNKGKINGIMFVHVTPWETEYLIKNIEKTGLVGTTVEKLQLSRLNSGLFNTVLERGDVRCIASGHTHEDDFSGEFLGIKLCLDGCAGYSPYGLDETRGGRVFEIDESDPSKINTYAVHYQDLK